jgi:hypothetical protein
MNNQHTRAIVPASQPRGLYEAPQGASDANLAARVTRLEAEVEKLDRLVYRLFRNIKDILFGRVPPSVEYRNTRQQTEPGA